MIGECSFVGGEMQRELNKESNGKGYANDIPAAKQFLRSYASTIHQS